LDSGNPEKIMFVTQLFHSGPARKHSLLRISLILTSIIAIGIGWGSPVKAATLLFDNISSDRGSNIAATASTPNTFMGGAYNLVPGASQITGFDLYPVNLSGTGFNALRLSIYVWGTVNTSGTVNATTPAFGNLLANYVLTSSGTFSSGFFFPFEGTPAGVNPGITLATPLSIPSSQIGLTFNYQGSTDGGVTFNSANSLTSLITFGDPPAVGSLVFSGYYRNAASEINGNFTSSLRTLGNANEGLGVRVYGNVVPEPGTISLVALGALGLVLYRRRR
jgi:hypothetical protein